MWSEASSASVETVPQAGCCDPDHGHLALILHEEFLRTPTQTISNGGKHMENNIQEHENLLTI